MDDALFADLLGTKRKRVAGPLVSVALVGFDKATVAEAQAMASDRQVPVRLMWIRDCRQACSLAVSRKVAVVVMSPNTRNHDRVTIDTIAATHDVRTVLLRENADILSALSTLFLNSVRRS